MKGSTQNTSVFMNTSNRIALGVLAGVSCAVFGFSSATLAQTSPSSSLPNNANPLKDLQTQDSTDPFSNRGNGQSSSVFDLIHRVVQGPSRSLEDFSAEQRESINSEADQFRAKQQKRLQNPTQVTEPKPAGTP